MKNLRNLLLAGILTFAGYSSGQTNYTQRSPDYFAEIPMINGGNANSSIVPVMISGDFNNDGNLDLVIGVEFHDNLRTYFLKGDGKGHFSLVKPYN